MMTSDSLAQLQSYLQQLVEQLRKYDRPDRKYCCFEELLLNCGVAMQAVPLPPKMERGLPQSCYYNAQKAIARRKSVTYVEGYAWSESIKMAVSHAWLMNRNGEALEITWEAPGTAYLGIPLETLWVKSFMKQRKHKDERSIFNGNYLEGYSLLKDGIPQEAIAL